MKKVLCTKCGFLNWSISDSRDERGATIRNLEINEYWRKQIFNGESSLTSEDQDTYEEYSTSCLRRQKISTLKEKVKKDGKYVDGKPTEIHRKCPYFFQYQPGFSPEEHKEIQREAENRKTTFRATIIGAMIGAAAAIVAQLLFVITTK